ncbi:cyclin-dependent protein kinase inhibitor SMR10-like [Hibiscus syriacus]|uniref:cyclin-dependent protein kinase inhibitor SMR10-like n=1 Tax=Hibiscus syriacus TaxID=106335 RepID=UPI0019204BDC|nr:cyclin-dependent protein kinase inhibitor SMR10-like [Hibiscus syriacus]
MASGGRDPCGNMEAGIFVNADKYRCLQCLFVSHVLSLVLHILGLFKTLCQLTLRFVCNSEMFKDLRSSTVELSFLVRPPLEFPEDQCQTAPNFQDVVIDDDGSHQRKEELVLKEDGERSKLKSPSSGEFNVADDENDDGFKTPTSLDHRIPAILKCPPAPRKPKSLPIKSPKRKAFRRRILLDLTKEMESLFPPALLADLGNKIKKVR